MYNTVPKKTWLPFLYSEGSVDCKAVMKFLNITRKDLAIICGVETDSIRFDSRTPEKQKRLFMQLANTCELVGEFFEGDKLKTQTWFRMPNPMLGFLTPTGLIKHGRLDKLVEVIVNAKEGNGP